MDQRISSVILKSLDRPDIGSISFALYTEGPYILENMDGYSAINSINTVVEPYQLRNGSSVSDPNSIGGKILNMLVHVTGANESETIRTINRLNAILQFKSRITVIDAGIEYIIDSLSLVSGSYNQTRVSPTHYKIEFGLASGSAYRVRSDVFEKIISGGGDVILGGIIYPTFTPYDDSVSYPDYVNAYNTVTSLFEQKIVIDGNGDIYPYFLITGTFYSVTITHTDKAGNVKTIELEARGTEGVNTYHEWWIDTEQLEMGATTPNIYGVPNWNDTPLIINSDWFILNIGENAIKVQFNSSGVGIVTTKWQEKYL